MLTWQITVLFAMAGCAIGCLLWICLAIEKLAKAFSSIGTELKKINVKIERIEAVNRDDFSKPMEQVGSDSALEEIEVAISNFEKLKRVDLTKA